MRSATYYTLAALLDGPSHGYGIIQRVRVLSEGQARLTTGTLYGTLERLAEEGLVRRTNTEVVNGRARQYFEITDEGSGAVRKEAERLAQAASAVQSKLDRPVGRKLRPAGSAPFGKAATPWAVT